MIKTITTTFDDLEKEGFTELSDYCRFLMKLNSERYKDMVVEVYRGDMLCLIAKSVESASKIKVNGDHWVMHRPKKVRRAGNELEKATGAFI